MFLNCKLMFISYHLFSDSFFVKYVFYSTYLAPKGNEGTLNDQTFCLKTKQIINVKNMHFIIQIKNFIIVNDSLLATLYCAWAKHRVRKSSQSNVLQLLNSMGAALLGYSLPMAGQFSWDTWRHSVSHWNCTSRPWPSPLPALRRSPATSLAKLDAFWPISCLSTYRVRIMQAKIPLYTLLSNSILKHSTIASSTRYFATAAYSIHSL